MKQPHFANARSVRNAIDRTKLRQASRLVASGGSVPKEELVRIAASDIRQSRVFQGGLEEEAETAAASVKADLNTTGLTAERIALLRKWRNAKAMVRKAA